MKTKLLIYLTSALLCIQICYGQNEHASRLTRIGFIAELSYLKSSSELLTSHYLNLGAGQVSDDCKNDLIKRYNRVKIIADQLILQMISDMNRKNSIKVFRRTDKFFTQHTMEELSESIMPPCYQQSLAILYHKYKELLDFKLQCNEQFLTALSLPEPLDLAGFITGALKDLSEARAAKVEKLSSILNGLRLVDVKGLTSDKSENNNTSAVHSGRNTN